MKKLFIFLAITCSLLTVSAQNWYQAGFRVGTSFATQRNYSFDGVYLNGLRNADFGIYFRAGKYVYGEVGFTYAFFKGDFTKELVGGLTEYSNQRVETRYLQIPIKAVGYIPFGRTSAVMPFAGIIYQPLVGVTANDIGYSKQTLERNLLFATAGLELKFGPIVFGCDYRYSFQTFFQNVDGKHPQYVHIGAGFQF